MKRRLAVLVIACAGLAACVSPEAARVRGGGRGGDIGNRPKVVKMHEGADEYWKTPLRSGVQHPPLEPARQAAVAEGR